MPAETTTRVIQYDIKGSREAIAAIKAQADAFDRLEKKIDGSIGTVKRFFDGLTAYVSISVVKGVFTSIIDGMDDLADKSQKLGMSAEALQEWAFAAQMSGTNAETMESGIKKLSSALANMGNLKSKSSQALQALGVTKDMGTDQAMMQLADAFSKMEDGFQKTALAAQIFGKSAGPELLPMLNMGSAGIKEYMKQARDMGQVVGEQTVQAVNALKDQLDLSSKSLQGAAKMIVEGMVPALSALATTFLEVHTNATGLRETGAQIGDMLINIAEGAIRAKSYIQQFAVVLLAAKEFANPLTGFANSDVLKMAVEQFKDIGKAADDAVANLRKNYKQAQEAVNQAGPPKPVAARVPELELGGGKTGKSPTEKAIDQLDAYTDSVTKASVQVKNLSQVQQLEFLILEKNIDVTDKRVASHYAEAKARAQVADLRDRNVRAEKEEVEAGLKHVEAMEKEQKEFEKLRQKYIDMGDPHEEYIRSLEEITKLATDPRVTDAQREQLVDAVDKLEKDYLAKIRKNAAGATSEIQELGKMLQQEIEGFAKNSADAIAEFCFGAKLNFSDMVKSILTDMAKLALKRAIDPFFKAVGDAASSGIGSFFKPSAEGNVFGPRGVVPFAQGGVVGGPTMFAMGGGGIGLMGEAGAEAVAPLMRSKSGKLGVSSSPVTVNVINNNGSRIKVEQTESSTGDKQLQIMVDSAVERSIGKGRFDRVLSTSYGVTRKGQ